MLEKLAIAITQIIMVGLTIAVNRKTVARTLSMTRKEKRTLTALTRKHLRLVPAKLLLAFAIKHRRQRVRADITQKIIRIYKVVTAIYVAIRFHSGTTSTSRRHRTKTRRLPYPIGQCGIEQLNIDLTDILLNPFVIYATKEMLLAGLNIEELSDYDVWLSDEDFPTDYPYRFSMWQYNKKGKIDGITGDIDLDMSFINYEQK